MKLINNEIIDIKQNNKSNNFMGTNIDYVEELSVKYTTEFINSDKLKNVSLCSVSITLNKYLKKKYLQK